MARCAMHGTHMHARQLLLTWPGGPCMDSALPALQTSGYSLTAQEPYNNIIRTTVEVGLRRQHGRALLQE